MGCRQWEAGDGGNLPDREHEEAQDRLQKTYFICPVLRNEP